MLLENDVTFLGFRVFRKSYGVGKWMHGEYAGVRERHIGHFVVKYVIDDRNSTVTIVDYDHHA